MKGKPSFENSSDHFRDENTSVEPAKLSDNSLKIYSPEEYHKPGKENKTWCSYMEKGFRASRTITDTNTGTDEPVPSPAGESETSAINVQPK